MKKIVFSFALCLITLISQAQSKVVYKQTPQGDLTLEVYHPKNWKTSDARKCIVFFFGGGWNSRNIEQFVPHATYLAKRGMVSIIADYRVSSDAPLITPKDCVNDAKSAMRYIRSHAHQLGINPDYIAASGGSAGGHLAAATAALSGLNDPKDDLRISCVPNALVLFNPVINNGPNGYGYDRVKDYYQEISPAHNIHQNMPPTLLMVGTKDHLVSQKTVLDFQKQMIQKGNQCDLYYYAFQPHGFFNKNKIKDPQYYHRTVAAMVSFLEGLGYLDYTEYN